MNPYSQLGMDQETSGYMSQAGINPSVAPPQSTQTAYPSYPNAAGVGSQTAGAAAQPVVPVAAPIATPQNEIPDASARGLTPYSLLGDANYRQGQQPA